ncbi:hypothetical protein E2C01_098000 [Portunus trituberculatus]|uniref:Uncharacterized protein n=1 Tax=Portunus trituberculatus TaxID=210409 RepID=A0A5B7K038_PORTR|nr:hypothetical protein [Portunus trituberculatus]
MLPPQPAARHHLATPTHQSPSAARRWLPHHERHEYVEGAFHNNGYLNINDHSYGHVIQQ